jgi:hypothetical protein
MDNLEFARIRADGLAAAHVFHALREDDPGTRFFGPSDRPSQREAVGSERCRGHRQGLTTARVLGIANNDRIGRGNFCRSEQRGDK